VATPSSTPPPRPAMWSPARASITPLPSIPRLPKKVPTRIPAQPPRPSSSTSPT